MKTLRSWAPSFLFFMLCLWMFFFNLRPIQSVDVWWHLASGRWIAQTQTIPTADPFSLLCKGSPWVDSYWLAEWVLYGFYRMVGLNGLIALKAAFVILILLFQEKRLRESGVPPFVRLLAVAGLFLSAHPRGYGWGEHLSLVTLFFMSLLMYHLERYRRDKGGLSLWIWPPLFMLWANTHRGFVLGGVVAACYVLGEALDIRQMRGRRWAWLAFCGLATLVTPYGWTLFSMIREDLTLSPVHVMGWAHPPWQHLELFWISLALLWGLLFIQALIKHEHIASTDFFLAIVLTWTGVRYVANGPYVMLFAWPYLALTGWRWTKKSAAYTFIARYERLVYDFALAVLLAAQASTQVRGGVNKNIFPVDACDFIEREHVMGPFYNDYGLGGYWLWRFAGSRPVFIDGRYPAVRGYQSLLLEIESAKGGPPKGWEQFLEHRQVEAALIARPKSDAVLSVLQTYFPSVRWALVYGDNTALVFLKRNAVNRQVIQRTEIPIRPNIN